MTAFHDARVLIFLADYASTDASGKINAIGAGFNTTQVNPQGGLTPPMYLVATIEVPRRYVDTQYPISVELRRDDTNAVVTVPGPTGPQALRFQQMVNVQAPIVPAGLQLPPTLMARHQLIVAFQTGLQLQPGISYRWRLEIETQSRPQWNAVFHVLQPDPAAGLVFGGPTEPTDPNLQPLEAPDVDDEEDPTP